MPQQTTLSLSDSLIDRLLALNADDQATINFYVRQAIEDYLDHQENCCEAAHRDEDDDPQRSHKRPMRGNGLVGC